MKIRNCIIVKILILIFICQFKYSNQSWISDKIGGIFGGIVDKAMSGMIDKAKAAFRESMDYLFDQKIRPMIDQIEAAAERAMDHAKEDIDEIIDHVTKEIEIIINLAAKTATEFVDHTIEEIEQKIIDRTFDQLKELESTIFTDITRMLNKIDEILKEVSCYAQAVISRIEEDIKKVLPSFYNPFETCRVKLNEIYPGIRWKLVSKMTHEELYVYRKCLLIKDLTPESKIQTIAAAYREIELLAGDMRCLSVALGSLSNEKYYIREMGITYEILHALEFSKKAISNKDIYRMSLPEIGNYNNKIFEIDNDENINQEIRFLTEEN